MGWGVFYWVVNVGAFGAPFLATLILGKPHSAEGWRNLFLASAGYTACNLLVLFTFRDVPSGADKTKSMAKTFAETVENIWIFWFVGGKLHAGRFTGRFDRDRDRGGPCASSPMSPRSRALNRPPLPTIRGWGRLCSSWAVFY
jgi:MFS family permease